MVLIYVVIRFVRRYNRLQEIFEGHSPCVVHDTPSSLRSVFVPSRKQRRRYDQWSSSYLLTSWIVSLTNVTVTLLLYPLMNFTYIRERETDSPRV